MKTANKIVRQAQKWLGKNEADGSFKSIIDLYNSVSPIPRGYKAKYTSEWCAITITALGYATGMTDIIRAECSVPKLMAMYKAMGIWLGADARPQMGDIVIYDWDSARDGDHIGIIEKVEGNMVTAIEGNMSERVGRRTYQMGWSRVTGYARPKYDDADAVFRVYNPNNGEHLFTTSVTEVYNLTQLGWRDEGIAWYAGHEGTAVRRVYNPNVGEHHYTTSQNEIDMLVKAGWKAEGVSFRAGGEVPVYRVYNPNATTGTHHFTISKEEYEGLIRAGWKDEGIAWKTLAK